MVDVVVASVGKVRELAPPMLVSPMLCLCYWAMMTCQALRSLSCHPRGVRVIVSAGRMANGVSCLARVGSLLMLRACLIVTRPQCVVRNLFRCQMCYLSLFVVLP